jgi:hypothetical protein
MLLPALAQAPSTGGEGQPPAPTAPNSGAGIPGQPGNQSGPAAKPTGSAESAPSDQQNARNQDASNIPGQGWLSRFAGVQFEVDGRLFAVPSRLIGNLAFSFRIEFSAK